MKQPRAFSLIEISIVLSLFGLLVAGYWVTAQKARQQQAMNRVQVEFGILINEYGKLCRNKQCDTTSSLAGTLPSIAPTFATAMADYGLYVNVATQPEYSAGRLYIRLTPEPSKTDTIEAQCTQMAEWTSMQGGTYTIGDSEGDSSLCNRERASWWINVSLPLN